MHPVQAYVPNYLGGLKQKGPLYIHKKKIQQKKKHRNSKHPETPVHNVGQAPFFKCAEEGGREQKGAK